MKNSKVHLSYIFLAYGSLMVQGLTDNIRGPLFPDLLEEFHLDNKQGSLFFSVASAMIIAGGYLGGYLIEKLGRVKTLQWSTLILLCSLLGVWQSSQFILILASVFFLGIAFGVMGVAQNVMVIEACEPGHVQRWQAGLQSTYGLASLTAPLLVSLLHGLGYPWRFSFLLAAILSGVLLLFSFFGKELKHQNNNEDHPGRSNAEIFYFGFILAAYVALEIMVSSRLAQFTREIAGWSYAETGTLNSLFFVGMFAGRFLFIFWYPKIHLKNQMLASLFLAFLSIGFGLFVHPLGFAFAGLSMAPFYPLFMTLAGKLFPNDLGKVTGHGIALTGVTVVAMQTLVGYIADQYGLKSSLLVGPGFAVLAALMILFYRPLFHRDMSEI